MVTFSELSLSSGSSLSIWAEDSTCSNAKSQEYGSCVISSMEMTRIYLVRVTAIDKAGNAGVGECSTIVGSSSTGNSPEPTPFFLVSKLEIAGGTESSAGLFTE